MLIEAFLQGEKSALLVAFSATLLLAAKSILDFSRSGPDIRDEVLASYRFYSLFAFIRLCAYAFVIIFMMASTGILLYVQLCSLAGLVCTQYGSTISAVLALVLLTSISFCWHLLHLPASLVASSHYRLSRVYPLWRQLTPVRLKLMSGGIIVLIAALTASSTLNALQRDAWVDVVLLVSFAFLIISWIRWGRCLPYPQPLINKQDIGKLNVLMLGSDTLRADRIRPDLTPNIWKLAERSVNFTHCYVPCARTAPSLASLLTGVWPHRHGVRDNFVANSDTQLTVNALPEMLSANGYVTSAISDWCGSDMGKFSFGFNRLDLPPDQWNLKYLIRQGPKDIRLFLSLFTHNNLGKLFLPEIYYLGGVPLTDQLGRATCQEINHLGQEGRPFFLNAFFSSTHPPFGSEYPYYTKFSPSEYSGESKFAMARLTDPWEIIRSQAEPREAFDLDQIIHLYDGCVSRFDDEVGRILAHLDACKLKDNTIVVIYSDHGMEFFEHGTWGQGNSAVGDHSARIPFIIADPRQKHNGTVGDVVRSIDLAPTLLELLDIRIENGMDGESLFAYIQHPSYTSQRDAYYETGIWLTKLPGMSPDHLSYPNIMDMLEVPDKESGALAIKQEFSKVIVAAKDRMIRSGKWKLVYQPLESGCNLLLFDVEIDPECMQNLFESHTEIAAELWGKLHKWMLSDTQCDQSANCLIASCDVVVKETAKC